ncbi:SRPBCC family protein [Actinotalea solisilvae]|uniref:SRPBCC family protein n=1 Tax=Actinotalea solisilvae TaxID=2072922 RepID=UPI0018F12C83|nr:SRPBCC domain-containing protein [Actinotalea solisilvae]
MTEIRVERTLAAPPERVYAAWTDPGLLGRWFCPNPDLALAVTADAVVGGRYRVDMGEGRYVAEGEYTALEPARLVAFTWRWTTSEDPASQVRVDLAPADDGGTRLVLVHSGLADADDASGHAEGWELSLDRLERLG